MNIVKENNKKAVFEPAEIEVITFDTKTDIICTSPTAEEGFEDGFDVSKLP